MRLAHIGDEAAGGFGGLCQRAYVARMARAHLHHGDVVVAGESQQGLGHPHIVVEVPLGRHHAVALSKHGTHEFFGRRLAIGAGDADDGDAELPPVFPRQVFEGLQGVVNEAHLRGVAALRHIAVKHLWVAHHRQGASLREGLCGKLIAIEGVAFQRDEDASLGAFTAVGGHHGVLAIKSIKFFDIHSLMI